MKIWFQVYLFGARVTFWDNVSSLKQQTLATKYLYRPLVAESSIGHNPALNTLTEAASKRHHGATSQELIVLIS